MRARFSILIFVVLLAPFTFGCSEDVPAEAYSPDADEVESTSLDEPDRPDGVDTTTMAVDNLRLVREADGSRAVRGVVLNGTDEERSVQVEIALYDARNQRIGEVQVPVEHIAAGGQQGFSRTLDRDAAGASVRRIVSY